MLYQVGEEFIKILEISGTVYNKSEEFTLEMSTAPETGSGVFIYPNKTQSFRYHDIYLRCVDGIADVEVVPYDLNPDGIGAGNKFIAEGTFLHLTFDFPTGSNKTMLLPNPRPNLTQADIDKFSEYVIEQDIFRNNFAEPTLGIKKAKLIQSLFRGKGDGTAPDYQESGNVDDDGNFGTTFNDLRRKLTRDADVNVDLRRLIATQQTLARYDLRRRVKWQWLTRILPDSSFLDPKMRAAAAALDDQITLFHWAIKEVLHLPRLDELSGTILDLLAYQFHVDAYDAINFTDEDKRELIRTSIAWHRIKGTPAAVEMVLGIAFGKYRVMEWFEYGGDPYYFRIYIKGLAYSPGSFQSFWRMFLDAKNVRSHLEKVVQDISPDDPFRIYAGVIKLITGNKKIPLHKPSARQATSKIFAGVAKFVTGNKKISLPKTTDRKTINKFFAGGVKVITGTRTIGMHRF